MKKNIVKEKLRSNELTVGAWLTFGSAQVAEYMAHAGFDWLVVDTQHGLGGHKDAIYSLQAITNTKVIPMARVAWNEPFLINRLQDAGAMGIVVPMINSPQQVKKAVEATRHGPRGIRSAGGGRGMFYDFGGETFEEFVEWSNKETVVVVMIEQKEAIEKVESILSVKGVDACIIGPADLALSMGTQVGESDHEEAIEKVLEGANATGTAAGIFCLSIEEARQRVDQGFKFISVTSDIDLLQKGAKEALCKLKLESY